MKRGLWIAAVALIVVVLGGGFLVTRHVQAQRYGGPGPGMMWDDGDGPGWGGWHRGWRGGGGMMWGGPGGMWGGPGDWEEVGPYSQLPQDKRAQLRDLWVETERKMVSLTAAMDDLRAAHFQALRKFPLDRDAAAKAWQGMDTIRKQMFDLRLDTLAKAQQILGKDLWDQLHEGWGPGGWGPGGRGPGGRGPRGPR